MSQEDRALDDKPEWLNQFLQRTFFDTCPLHNLPRNELTKYCIDCDESACRYCIAFTSHLGHRTLKIYRHVYKDVVLLSDIENHVDCSKIQAYRCNKKWVIAMNPLPHCGSSSKAGSDSSCAICIRKLIDPKLNRYCSIACKVEAFARKKNKSDPPFLSIRHSAADKKVKERKRKRKGIPHRAPYC